MKGKYKKGTACCFSCDGAVVEIGKKCEECGVKMKGSKSKKPTTKQILNDL
tara:strand:+ start:746 stop:898 length:153 start_codon:yes stop_codon:yes gene_type:complete